MQLGWLSVYLLLPRAGRRPPGFREIHTLAADHRCLREEANETCARNRIFDALSLACCYACRLLEKGLPGGRHSCAASEPLTQQNEI